MMYILWIVPLFCLVLSDDLYKEDDLVKMIKCMNDCECCLCDKNEGVLLPGGGSCGKYEAPPKPIEVDTATGKQTFMQDGQCPANACACVNYWLSPSCKWDRFSKSFNHYTNKCIKNRESTSEICQLFKQYSDNNGLPKEKQDVKWAKFDYRWGMPLNRGY
uniref:Uncharacterized protein n=1 Tax=Acrobeloides nanus TaxID=290746 RepID=A0A914CMM0_9BILA